MELVFVLLLLVLFSLLMLGWPRTGAAMALALTMLWPSYIVIQVSLGLWINPQRLILPICLLIWLIHVLYVPAYRSRLRQVFDRHRTILNLIAAGLLIAVISGFLSPFNKSQAVWGALNQILFLGLPMLLVITYFRHSRSVKKLIGLMVAVALVSQLVGLVEFSQQQVVFSSLVAPGTEHAEQVLEGKTRYDQHRVTSVFDNPLSYAQFLVFMFPVLLFFTRFAETILGRVVVGAQLLAIPISVWTTASRTGLALVLLCVFAGVGAWVLRARIERYLQATLLLMIAGVLFASTTFLLLMTDSLTFFDGTQSIAASTTARLFQLVVGIPAIAVSPVYGVGIHQATNFMQGLTSIDNYYLTVVLEKGLLGLLILVVLQWKVLVSLFQGAKSSRAADLRYFSACLFVSFSALYLFQITLSVIEVFTVSNVLLAGFLSWTCSENRAKEERIDA
ncbi:MAG: hypothetical protein QNJ19_00895 [Woeseiaceae bacterium]|nr:hypothetical protein [Woeseiaceae bacterium]